MTQHVPKKTIPHASAATTPAHVLVISKHAQEQLEAGHYKLENVSITQSENPDGSQHLTGSFDRVETDPSAPAEPHGLTLS